MEPNARAKWNVRIEELDKAVGEVELVVAAKKLNESSLLHQHIGEAPVSIVSVS